MTNKQLYYFTVIVETGSFTAAAKELKLSQPPLSRHILALEEELGVLLMVRNARKIVLTDAGSFLYERAKQILSCMDSTITDIQNLKACPNQVVKLGTISSSAYLLTMQILNQFSSDYPNVTFEVTEGNTYEILEKLNNNAIECAIVRTPFNTDGLHCAYGVKEPLTAVGRDIFFQGLPSSHIKLTDLIHMPLIYYRRFESIISIAFQNTGIKPNVFCKNDDARTSILWAGTGLGIALVPYSISRLSLADHLTVKVIDSPDTVTQMAAVYKKNSYISNPARQLIRCFQEASLKNKNPV